MVPAASQQPGSKARIPAALLSHPATSWVRRSPASPAQAGDRLHAYWAWPWAESGDTVLVLSKGHACQVPGEGISVAHGANWQPHLFTFTSWTIHCSFPPCHVLKKAGKPRPKRVRFHLKEQELCLELGPILPFLHLAPAPWRLHQFTPKSWQRLLTVRPPAASQSPCERGWCVRPVWERCSGSLSQLCCLASPALPLQLPPGGWQGAHPSGLLHPPVHPCPHPPQLPGRGPHCPLASPAFLLCPLCLQLQHGEPHVPIPTPKALLDFQRLPPEG